jgi:uncharacterized protein (TIGR02246 family)
MKADAQTTEAVNAALRRMTDAYARRDLNAFLVGFSTDADVMIYGTGADERRIGTEQIRAQVTRDWDQSESATMSFDTTLVSAAGAVAWAAIDGAFKFRIGGKDMAMPARATFVLEKRDGKWLILHGHFSTPAASQEQGQSF